MSPRKWDVPAPGGSGLRLILLLALSGAGLFTGCLHPSARSGAGALTLHFDPAQLPVPNPAGPTFRFDFTGTHEAPSPITNFMYFIPLISPEPVSMTMSPRNTQGTRILTSKRRVTADSFLVECEFDIVGAGWLTHSFDHRPNAKRNEQKLAGGGMLERVLDSITIDGSGSGTFEVEGAITNGIASVSEVRLHFNAHGHPSPVNIGVVDLRMTNGIIARSNEHIARVNTLSFRRGPGPTRMGVTVASIRRKDGAEGLWSKITGLAATFVLKPIKVDPAGHEAMLNFGRQLAAEAPSFTFPIAKNLGPDSRPK